MTLTGSRDTETARTVFIFSHKYTVIASTHTHICLLSVYSVLKVNRELVYAPFFSSSSFLDQCHLRCGILPLVSSVVIKKHLTPCFGSTTNHHWLVELVFWPININELMIWWYLFHLLTLPSPNGKLGGRNVFTLFEQKAKSQNSNWDGERVSILHQDVSYDLLSLHFVTGFERRYRNKVYYLLQLYIMCSACLMWNVQTMWHVLFDK